MATVIGVRFKNAGKVYYFDPCDFWPRPGQKVVVETMRGMELGEVVTGVRKIEDEQLTAELKKVIRVATPEDEHNAEVNTAREIEAFDICKEKIVKHGLDMKLVRVEYTFDNSKIIFYFTSNGRVDFRELVKDLASVFHMRIELRQIGVRDEAKMLGGLGSCGRPICCRAFLNDFQPVSIKMAKEQNLSLNPTKISGLCGRLMCCLKYEQDTYDLTLKRVPRVGKDIVTPDGVGVITEINAIRETVKVRINTDGDDFEVREYSMDDVRRPNPDERPARRDVPRPERHEKIKDSAETGTDDSETNNAPEGESASEGKKRYPRQKAPKNLSTDQFIERMQSDAENTEPEDESTKEHRRRRRGGRGRHHGADRMNEGAVNEEAQSEGITAESASAENAQGSVESEFSKDE